MARKNIITKDEIIAVAIDCIRENGVELLNARSLASRIGCSTQPIFSLFKNMEELKSCIKIKAQEIQKQKIASYFDKMDIPKYKAYGMGFVKFAKDERELFKLLYMPSPMNLQTEKQDINYEEIIKSMQNSYKLTRKQAEDFHLDMSIYTFGLAVLQSMGQNISDEDVAERLKAQFDAEMLLFKSIKNKEQ